MRIKLIFTFLVLMVSVSNAQQYTSYDSAYANVIIARPELRWIMDTPTAGTLPRGAFDLELKTFPGGGVRSTLDIGLTTRFSVGIGYGASHVLADVEPDWNSEIEFLLKFRLHEETDEFPAISIGYCSIGNGAYDDENNRYTVKSPGFYLAFSKNFGLYNNPAAWHWGINYSLETDEDNDPSAFVGFSSDLGHNMTFLSEVRSLKYSWPC